MTYYNALIQKYINVKYTHPPNWADPCNPCNSGIKVCASPLSSYLPPYTEPSRSPYNFFYVPDPCDVPNCNPGCYPKKGKFIKIREDPGDPCNKSCIKVCYEPYLSCDPCIALPLIPCEESYDPCNTPWIQYWPWITYSWFDRPKY